MAAVSEAADVDARAAAQREHDEGNSAVGRRDWAAAEEHYSASLALRATPAVYSNRAAARLALGRAAEAVADAKAALALDATFVKASLRLSAAHRALGDDEAALTAAREGLAVAQYIGSPLAEQLHEAAAELAQRFENAPPEPGLLFLAACAHCGKARRKRRVCAACRQVSFCDAECQRAGRPAHREACKIGARLVASRAAEAGLAEPPRPAKLQALERWVAKYPAHMSALQLLAWTLQHAPPPRCWGVRADERGRTGAIQFNVLDSCDATTLRVALWPLSLLQKGMDKADALGLRAEVDHPSTQNRRAILSRVDVDVGYLVSVRDDSPQADAYNVHRMRYSLPTDELEDWAEEMLRERWMRVDADAMLAEVNVTPILSMLASDE